MNNKCTYSLYKNRAKAKGKQLAGGHQYFISPGGGYRGIITENVSH